MEVFERFASYYQSCFDAVRTSAVNNLFESIENYLYEVFVNVQDGIGPELFPIYCEMAVSRLDLGGGEYACELDASLAGQAV